MASPGNQHCANCIGTLSFPITAWSVCVPVCLSVGHTVNPAKTAEPIEMTLRLWTRVSPRNHVGPGYPHGKGQFWRLFPPLKWTHPTV